MSRTKKGTPPSYPAKPHKGQARITVRLAGGRRKEIYLGPFGSSESRAEYRRILAELEVNAGLCPVQDDGRVGSDLTVSELALRFWEHARVHYRLADGSPSRELEHYRSSLEPTVQLYGHIIAQEFGPLALKAIRKKLIEQKRHYVRLAGGRGRWLPESRVRLAEGTARPDRQWIPGELVKSEPALSRKVINQRIDHVKRVFGWAVGEELIPAAVHDALLRVRGLRRGRQGTFDHAKVKPVADEDVQKTLPFLLPQVAAMVQLQALIGARPTEVCLMRGRNIVDRDRPVWRYIIDPNEVERDEGRGRVTNLHKTAGRENADGHATVKILPIGPKAQAILRPWLRPDEDEYFFQPREARAAQYTQRRRDRKTPLYPSHLRVQKLKAKGRPQRVPRDHCDRFRYGHAVARAAKRAAVPHWHPHQLKHVCGTKVREQYGAEAAQGYLGHEKLSTAELYAEKNWKLVEQIAREIG